MAFIFKKINNLFEPRQEGSAESNVVNPTDANQVVQTNQKADPYKSTFRDFSKIYEANKPEGSKVETGLSKNIAEQTQNMAKSSEALKQSLTDVSSQYQYNPETVKDIQPNFSKLQSLLSPTQQIAELQSKESSTADFAPDTQGLAQASTVGGLSSLLRNQYGTTQGQSRLDALLSRGSGQAGQSIRENLQNLQNFRDLQKQNLAAEDVLKNQYIQQAQDTAGTVRGDLLGQRQSYEDLANQQMATAQEAYNQLYGQRQKELEDIVTGGRQFNPEQEQQLRDAITNRINKLGLNTVSIADSAAARSQLESTKQGRELLKWIQSNPDSFVQSYESGDNLNPYLTSIHNIAPYLSDKFASAALKDYALPEIDLTKYIEAPDVYQQEQYLNPEFNLIQTLLQEQGKDLTVPKPDDEVTYRQEDLQKLIDDTRNKYIADTLADIQKSKYTGGNTQDFIDRYGPAIFGGVPGVQLDWLGGGGLGDLKDAFGL